MAFTYRFAVADAANTGGTVRKIFAAATGIVNGSGVYAFRLPALRAFPGTPVFWHRVHPKGHALGI